MTEQTPDPAAGAPHASSGPTRWEAPAAGSSRPATDLAAASQNLLGSGARQLDSAALSEGPLTYSDLDLMLLHDNMPHDIGAQVPELLWYPLWDANIRIDHSVRTVPEAMKVAGEDISAGLAMLEARHITGDADLSTLLI